MTIQLILLEIALGLLVLGAFIAYKKSIGERLCILALVFISYLAAFLLTKAGVFDGVSNALLSLISSMEGIGEIFTSSALISSSILAIISGLIRPFFMTLTFLLLCIVLRIILAIVIKAAKLREKLSFFSVQENEKIWKKILVCAIGAVTFYSLFMLSYLPIASLENIVKPAVENARSEEYEGTYAYEFANIADDYFLPTGESTAFGKMQRFTGFGSILKGTANSLAKVSAKDENGRKITFNSTELLQNIVSCGSNAVIFYEYTCRPDDFTLKDAECVADIVDSISDSPILLETMLEIMTNLESDAEEEGALGQTLIIDSFKDNYADQDVTTLQGDLDAVSSLIKVVCSDLETVSLRQSKLIPEVLNYLSVKENTDKVVNELSKLTFYEETINIVAENGLNFLCSQIGISENEQDYYEDYIDSLYAALNEREYGDYFNSDVESFIVYAAENNITVSEYKIENEDELTEIDFAYKNYIHFMPAMEHFEDLFANYLLDDKNALSAYTTADGTIYVYDSKNDNWSLYTDEVTIKSSSLAAQMLSDKIKDIFNENIEYTITKDDIKIIGAEMITKLEQSETLNVSEDRLNETCTILKTFLSSESFDPKDAVYRLDVIDSLNLDSSFDEKDNSHFASIIATAMNFVNQIYGKDSSDFSIYISNFDLVGRLLDDLQGMKKTQEVPKSMLLAITQHKEYGKYFVSDSIKELTENVQNGSSSYEELFISVEALYNIVNQIIPEE